MHFSRTNLVLPVALLAIGTMHADPVLFIKNISNRDIIIAPFNRKGDWITQEFVKPKGEYKEENLDANTVKGVHIKYCPQGVRCSSMDEVNKNGGTAVEFEFHDPSATKFYLKFDIDKKDNASLKRQDGRAGRTSDLKWSLKGNIIQDAIIKTTVAPAAPTDAPTPPSFAPGTYEVALMTIIAQEDLYIKTLQDMVNGTMALDESLLKDSGFEGILNKPMAAFKKRYGTNLTFNDREKDLIDTHTANYQKASNLLGEARKLVQKPKTPQFSPPPTDMPPALPKGYPKQSTTKTDQQSVEEEAWAKFPEANSFRETTFKGPNWALDWATKVMRLKPAQIDADMLKLARLVLGIKETDVTTWQDYLMKGPALGPIKTSKLRGAKASDELTIAVSNIINSAHEILNEGLPKAS